MGHICRGIEKEEQRRPTPVRATQGQGLRVAQILADHIQSFFKEIMVNDEQAKVLHNLLACRTEAMDSHIWRCEYCGHEEVRYNSCHNRLCPTCYKQPQAVWLTRRKGSMLRVLHEFLTFGTPQGLRGISQERPTGVYDILFKAISASLLKWAMVEHGVRPGISTTVHTHTRTLLYYLHFHSQVSGGGIRPSDEKWKGFEIGEEEREQIEEEYKEKAIEWLEKSYRTKKLTFDEGSLYEKEEAYLEVIEEIKGERWPVYLSKRSNDVEEVLTKQATYIHKPAITDRQLVSYEGGEVTFRTGEKETITLKGIDFVKRFITHILAGSFHRTRHTGLYSSYDVGHRLPIAKRQLPKESKEPLSKKKSIWDCETWEEVYVVLWDKDPRLCPICKKLGMKLQKVVDKVVEDQLTLFYDSS